MKGDYEQRWRAHRRGTWAVALLFLTFIPAGIFVAPLINKLLPPAADAEWVIFPVWFVGIIISAFYLMHRRCPRCRKYFYSKSWHHNPYARKCLHCGLRKYAAADEAGKRRR